MAFTFEGENDFMRKDDPRYVKVLARLWTKTNGVKTERILNFHKCTQDDYNEFFPIVENQ